MTTLAVTSAGRRRYVVEALLEAASPDDTLVVTDLDPYAPALAVPGTIPVVPKQPGAHVMSELLYGLGVDALLSLHDYETVDVASHIAEFESRGIRFIGPTHETAVTTIDKIALAEHIAAVAPGHETPTYRVSEIPGLPQEWVLKDRYGSGSSGLQIVRSRDEARAIHRDRARTQGWHPEGEVRAVEVIAQPLLHGREFNVDLFFADTGELRGHCVKEKGSMRGGETDTAHVTEDVFNLVPRVTSAISGLSFIGNVDVDVILHADDTISILDVNPRFGGGYAFSVLAGYDVARSVWAIARGASVTEYHRPLRELRAAKYIAVAEVTEVPRPAART